MKNRKNYPPSAMRFLSLTLSLVLIGLTIQAQPPSGSLQYRLTIEDGLPLWNFSGSYSLPIYSNLQWNQDARGRLTAWYDADGTTNTGLVGTIRGVGSKLKLRLRSTGALPEYVLEADYWAMRKDQLLLSFDPLNHKFPGTDRVIRMREQLVMDCPNSFWECNNWKLARSTSSSIHPIELEIPETADGNWSLSLDIVPTANKLSGTASVTFSNGEVFKFQLVGRYAPRTQRARLVLKGEGDDKGATLMLLLSGESLNIEAVNGIVGGQRIRFP